MDDTSIDAAVVVEKKEEAAYNNENIKAIMMRDFISGLHEDCMKLQRLNSGDLFVLKETNHELPH